MSFIKNKIATALCSDFVGAFLAKVYNNQIPSRRYGKFIYDCSSDYLLDSVKASIFWGIYESAEVRFVRQYLRSDLDVIELGASIGVVTTQILRKIESANKCIALEANPNLMETLKSNLQINNKAKNYHIINKAISYNGEDEITYQEEIAFGGNHQGPGFSSNWWYYYDTQGLDEQPIYAGQELTDGTVKYQSNQLIIDLGSWELQDVSQPVKIQWYANGALPGFRPDPVCACKKLVVDAEIRSGPWCKS